MNFDAHIEFFGTVLHAQVGAVVMGGVLAAPAGVFSPSYLRITH